MPKWQRELILTVPLYIGCLVLSYIEADLSVGATELWRWHGAVSVVLLLGAFISGFVAIAAIETGIGADD